MSILSVVIQFAILHYLHNANPSKSILYSTTVQDREVKKHNDQNYGHYWNQWSHDWKDRIWKHILHRMQTSYSLLCLDRAFGKLSKYVVQQSYQSWRRMKDPYSGNAIWPTLDKFLMTGDKKLHQHVQNINHEWFYQRWTVEHECKNSVILKDKLLEMQCKDQNYHLIRTRISYYTNDKLRPTSMYHISQ